MSSQMHDCTNGWLELARAREDCTISDLHNTGHPATLTKEYSHVSRSKRREFDGIATRQGGSSRGRGSRQNVSLPSLQDGRVF